MAPSRLRLAALSHTQLLELAAAGCEASSEVASQGEAILLVVEGVQRAIEGVLLSSDLLPYVLAPLRLEDGVAAAVCSVWARGWKGTGQGRRRLLRVAFDFPQHRSVLDQFAVIPGDDERLVLKMGERGDCTTQIIDRNMETVASFKFDEFLSGPIAADEQSIYATVDGARRRGGEGRERVCRLAHDGTEVASYRHPDGGQVFEPVLAPGGLLFCVRFSSAWSDQGHCYYDQDEILALDAQSMQLRYQFPTLPFQGVLGLAVVGEELFVCVHGMDSLEVFSLAGEHRRSITGEWKQPAALCCVKDRLYVIEEEDDGFDEEDEDAAARFDPRLSKRIFALSLQGDTLQVYPIPVEVHRYSRTLLYFNGMLLAPHSAQAEWDNVGVVALLGA